MRSFSWFNGRVTSDELIADLRRQLADAKDANAALHRAMERQGFQLDRMQDQLERALKELEVLRRLLNKPPPDEPSPPRGSGASAGGDGGVPPSPAHTPRREKPPPKKKGRFGRNAIPAGLERVQDRQEPGECPHCEQKASSVLRDETVEMFDYIPARVVARTVVRPVSRCTRCQHIVVAPFPETLAPRLRATPALIAYILFEKYGRHVTLHRIDQELARLGATIPETTRDQWLIWAARQLAVLVEPLKRLLFGVGLLHTDGTGLDVLEPKMGTRLGQMAVYCNNLGAWYVYTPSKHGHHQRQALGLEGRDGKVPATDAARFTGYLVADAASVADRTFLDGRIVECGCNAHARRKFEDAEAVHRKLAGEALAFWTALYAVEAEARRRTLDSDAVLVLRHQRSRPILADFRRWIDTHLGTQLPQDPLTKALNYANNHWAALTRFLDDGRIPLDNNPAERMLRAVAIGRKNYLFAGSDAAAGRSALFYTFVMTCRVNRVDPYEWLTDVLPRVAATKPSRLPGLLPGAWTERRIRTLAA